MPRVRDGDGDGDGNLPRSIPITEPLTFSSVDWNRAKAGTAFLRRTLERAAAEVARGSFSEMLAEIARAVAKRPTTGEVREGLTALENREASIVNVIVTRSTRRHYKEPSSRAKGIIVLMGEGGDGGDRREV